MSTSPIPLSHSSDSQRASVSTLRWRSWPLVDHPRWLPSVFSGLLLVGGAVWWFSRSWPAALIALACLAAALWQYLLPVTYEIHALGLSRYALGRTQILPWHAIRSFQPRSTGIMLFQRTDPTPMDAYNGWFLPYSKDEDETLCSIRQHLRHAVEMP